MVDESEAAAAVGPNHHQNEQSLRGVQGVQGVQDVQGARGTRGARGGDTESVGSVNSGGSASLLSGDIGRGLEVGYGGGWGVTLLSLDLSMNKLTGRF